jgi:uncharacterized protein involved in exopolysaccharide biosynthesis
MNSDNRLDEVIDFREFFLKVLKNWYLFVLSLILTVAIAFSYNRYSAELYKVETTILINDDKTSLDPNDLFYENGIRNQQVSLENQELILRSYPLIYSVLDELAFDISYQIMGNIKVTETYISPFKVESDSSALLKGKSIILEYINEESFMLSEALIGDRTYYFGEKINFYGTDITVDLNYKYSSPREEYPKVVVVFSDLAGLTKTYQEKLLVTQLDNSSTVINISIIEEDQWKGIVFLNKLTERYIINELNDKNLSSKNTVDFINKQLKDMSDSLSLIEQHIQEYKNKNQITDLSKKAENIYTNIVNLETELAKSKNLSDYCNYLENYMKQGNELERITVPTSFGINDLALNRLISQLIEIQIKKNILVDGGQINNPAIAQYNRKTKQLSLNLQEAIRTTRDANNLIIKDFKVRIRGMKSSLGDIPEVERKLLNIERLQAISENIYIFLLKKRAEAKITSSSNISDVKVLEPARYFRKLPISPDKDRNYLIAILLGLFLPLVFLLLKEIINDKIITRSDLQKITDIPILAMIGRNYSGYNLLSKQSPKSAVYEGFRALRSNLNFLNPDSDKKVYLVTSSISGEGKTYIAMNMAIVFARSSKRTLVIGADLRRPKLYSEFSLKNDVGISSHILGDKKLDEVILSSEIENLDILLSGPLPSTHLML